MTLNCTHNDKRICADCTAELFAETFDVIVLAERNRSNDPEDQEQYNFNSFYKCPICEAIVSNALLHTIYHVNRGEELPS